MLVSWGSTCISTSLFGCVFVWQHYGTCDLQIPETLNGTTDPNTGGNNNGGGNNGGGNNGGGAAAMMAYSLMVLSLGLLTILLI